MGRAEFSENHRTLIKGAGVGRLSAVDRQVDEDCDYGQGK